MKPSEYDTLVMKWRRIDAEDPARVDRRMRWLARLGELAIPAYVLLAFLVMLAGAALIAAALANRRGRGMFVGLVLMCTGGGMVWRQARAWWTMRREHRRARRHISRPTVSPARCATSLSRGP